MSEIQAALLLLEKAREAHDESLKKKSVGALADALSKQLFYVPTYKEYLNGQTTYSITPQDAGRPISLILLGFPDGEKHCYVFLSESSLQSWFGLHAEQIYDVGSLICDWREMLALHYGTLMNDFDLVGIGIEPHTYDFALLKPDVVDMLCDYANIFNQTHQYDA